MGICQQLAVPLKHSALPQRCNRGPYWGIVVVLPYNSAPLVCLSTIYHLHGTCEIRMSPMGLVLGSGMKTFIIIHHHWNWSGKTTLTLMDGD